MSYPFMINCGVMPVLNTSWLSPWADREAQELPCTVDTFDPDGQLLALKITFPKCKIRRVTDPARVKAVRLKYNLPANVRVIWMVDPVTARSPISQATRIYVTYPEEPTVRASLINGGNIDVLPVNSVGGNIVLPNGISGTITSTLPKTIGEPVGLGLWQYNVKAVTCEGEVTWDSSAVRLA